MRLQSQAVFRMESMNVNESFSHQDSSLDQSDRQDGTKIKRIPTKDSNQLEFESQESPKVKKVEKAKNPFVDNQVSPSDKYGPSPNFGSNLLSKQKS